MPHHPHHHESIRIIPFGPGAGRVARHLSVSSFALTLGPSWMLLDCGESTQHRVLDSSLRLPRLAAVLVSSLQADHVLGLPGLLAALGSQRRTQPLAIHGPAGINELLSTILRVTGGRTAFPLEIHELRDGIVRKAEPCVVSCHELPSRVPTFGFHFNVDGHEIAYCPDSRSSGAASELARNVDLLIHEAVYAESNSAAARAEGAGQASGAQAARVAREASARRLLLAHFSPRSSNLNPLLAEAREIFPATELARDRVPIDFSVNRDAFPRAATL